MSYQDHTLFNSAEFQRIINRRLDKEVAKAEQIEDKKVGGPADIFDFDSFEKQFQEISRELDNSMPSSH